MTQAEKAAIIGYWRSGATMTEIVALTGYPQIEIEMVIEKHKLNQ